MTSAPLPRPAPSPEDWQRFLLAAAAVLQDARAHGYGPPAPPRQGVR